MDKDWQSGNTKRIKKIENRHLRNAPSKYLSIGLVFCCFGQRGKLAETLSQEAIWHQVPILGVPLLYEQKLNAQLIKKNNLGRVVDFDNFDQARANSQFCQRCL